MSSASVGVDEAHGFVEREHAHRPRLGDRRTQRLGGLDAQVEADVLDGEQMSSCSREAEPSASCSPPASTCGSSVCLTPCGVFVGVLDYLNVLPVARIVRDGPTLLVPVKGAAYLIVTWFLLSLGKVLAAFPSVLGRACAHCYVTRQVPAPAVVMIRVDPVVRQAIVSTVMCSPRRGRGRKVELVSFMRSSQLHRRCQAVDIASVETIKPCTQSDSGKTIVFQIHHRGQTPTSVDLLVEPARHGGFLFFRGRQTNGLVFHHIFVL